LIEYVLKFCENCVLYCMISYMPGVCKWSKIIVLVIIIKSLTVGVSGAVWMKQWAVGDIWVSGNLISSILINYTSINKRCTFMLPALTWNWYRFLDIYTLLKLLYAAVFCSLERV